MKKKKLLIDVNSIVPYYVSGKVNGIGRTTLELLQALADIDNLPFEIELPKEQWIWSISLSSRSKRGKDMKTDFARTWHRLWQISIRESSVFPVVALWKVLI